MTQPQQPDYRALLKRSLAAIGQLEEQLAAAERSRTEPIAIVGIGCRFPGGVNGPSAFWELLRDGVDAITEVPRDRWDADAYYDPDPDAVGKSYTKWGGFVGNVDAFDAPFFGISPREAVSLDPQQRLLLEVAWESLEHAGIAPSSIAGSRAAVYVGISTHDYLTQFTEAAGSANGDAYTPSGSAYSVAAGRLSYFLGLHGPNAAIDTACSSSLVAVHLGVQSLRNGEASLALVGGVNLTLSPTGNILTSRARMMSFDGRCKTFDAAADGYVRSEGCGMLVLKRLSDAHRDGDRVLALIRGSALNQDGRSSGLAAPNGVAQESVIRDALANARLSPSDISVIEAHGTGTPLGDPIEINALGQVFGQRDAQRPLLVGSVKTNIGHVEAAAGVAGVIKTVLALQHRVVPPHLHFRSPSPYIPWGALPIRVPTESTEWDSPTGTPRRAGVSSFGFSGTNAHLVLEEAPPRGDAPGDPTDDARRPRLLVLSAQSPAALREQASRVAAHLRRPGVASLRDVAFTAGTARSNLSERLAVVANDATLAAQQLDAFVADESTSAIARARAASGAAPEVAFLFTGQGAQSFGMARELYDSQPVYRAAMDACAAIVDPMLGRSLLAVTMTDESARGLLDDTAYTQPALFAMEYSLAQLWRAWGVTPTVAMGHSVGEYVAACLAGVFTLEDGLQLVAHRGRLMSALPRDGAMAAVFAGEGRVAALLRGQEREIAIAGVNGPAHTVISGRACAVETILSKLADDGIEWQRLNVSHAFHSPLMDPMLHEFECLASEVKYSPANIGIVSNVTGRMAGAEIATAAYWRRHARDAVRFSDGIATLHAEKIRTFLEVGPSPTLLRMAQRCPRADEALWLPSLRKDRGDSESMLASLGDLWVRGQRIDWGALAGPGARRVELPTYPFQRERHWHDLAAHGRAQTPAGRESGHPLLGHRLASPLIVYQNTISVAGMPWLADHRVYDLTLFPATGFLELALAAARHSLGDGRIVLENLSIHQGLVLPTEGAVTVQVIVTPGAGGGHKVEVFSAEATNAADAEWRRHVSATIASDDGAAPPAHSRIAGRDALPTLDVAAYYTRLQERGFHYGPAFRGLVEVASDGRELVGRVQLPAALHANAARLQLHPALLDCCLQLVGVGLPWDAEKPDELCVPVGVDQYRVHRTGVTEAWCHAVLEPADAKSASIRCDVTMRDDAGIVLAEMRGLEFQRVTRAALQRQPDAPVHPDWLYGIEWVEAPLSDDGRSAAPGRWLVLGEDDAFANELAAQLEARGNSVAIVSHRDELRSLVESAATGDAPHWSGVVSLLGVGGAVEGGGEPDENLSAASLAPIADVLAALPAIVEAGAPYWMLTRGSQAVAGSIPVLGAAPAWGLGGVVAAEYPGLRAVRIDLDPLERDDDAALVATSLAAADDETRVALRAGRRYVSRLVPGPRVTTPEIDAPRRLEIDERGVLENLRLTAAPRPEPGPGEIEIRVLATGLNFRDVLNALGMYPGDPGPLGNECAGVVTRIGPGVTDFSVGDEVVSMADHCFATFVVAPSMLTVRKPRRLTFAEAATIPVTFLTAEWALSHFGGVKAGDRVLVHAATGGVGMAAMQLARRAGAEIFATAGSPAKRALARSLGAHHVSDSRSLAFVDDFTSVAGGRGMHLVLNSLAGEFIPASLGLVREGGHFVEIGKTGIWDAAAVGESFPGLHYHRFYLGESTAEAPAFMRDMLQRLMNDFASGELTPLPLTTFPIERSEEAFRFMGQGRHTGKIVIVQERAPEVRADASYLITGGLGGLGLACARGLAARGARHLVLMGRSAPSGDARAAISELEHAGVTVTVASGDVAVAADVRAVFEGVRANSPPLRGILHAAGVVDDGMLSELELGRFERTMAPKLLGAWHLHVQTLREPVDFFVMFSSVAALFGSPGQGNYAAANSAMDALAFVRRSYGHHALSINWGSWSEVGMAADVSERHRRRWAEQGLGMIAPADGVRMLFDALRRSSSAQVACLPLDPARLPRNLGSFFERIHAARSTPMPATGETPAVDLLRRLADATVDERAALVTEFLIEQLTRVLALDRSTSLRTDQSVMEMGLDSLMAMELRNRVQSVVKIRLSVAELLAGPTVRDLTGRILQSVGHAPELVPSVADAASSWEEGSL